MALIRVVPYGQPIRPEYLLDLGPAHARLSFEGTFGGPLEPMPTRPVFERAKLDSAIERERRTIAASVRPRCGYLMPISQEPCARRVGHKSNDHRTAEAVRKNIERRRRGYWG